MIDSGMNRGRERRTRLGLTMSDVYLTLLSDVSSDYANIEASHFKVKLAPSLYLQGTGWKVSIAYAMLP